MKRRSAVKILARAIEDDAELQKLVEQERLNARVAQLIYDARQAAGLTQQQLAELIGTRQPVIARLEDADYGGHSLRMLFRIAAALGHEIDIQFRSRTRKRTAARKSVKA